MRFRARVITLIILFILCSNILFAQWPTSPDSAILIGSGRNKQVVEDGQGGAYIVHGDYNGLCTRINHDGVKVWEDVSLDGVYDEQPHQSAALASDSSLIVSYRDIKYIGGWDWGDAHIRVQKISPDGEKLWGEGVVVTPDNASGTDDYFPYINSYVVSDDLGGAYVAWKDYRNDPWGEWSDLFIQKINSEGEIVWDSLGVLVDTVIRDLSYITFSSSSGVLLVYTRAINNWIQIHAQIVEPDKSFTFLERYNFNMQPLGGFKQDSEEHIFYHDYYTSVYKVDLDFQHIWPTEGIKISDTVYSILNLIPDESGGAIVQFRKDESSGRFFSQWVDNSGQLQYDSTALFVTKAKVKHPSVSLSGSESFISTYQGDNSHIAQRIDRNGDLFWPDNTKIYGYNNYTSLWGKSVSDGADGIIYVFDINSSSYVTQLGPNGLVGSLTGIDDRKPNSPLPDALRLVSLYPNPFNSSLAIQCQINTYDKIYADIYDLNGRYIQSTSQSGKPGVNRLLINFSTAEISSGIYLINVWTQSNPELKQVVKATYLK
ncbi:MAG: T9SS type A sorting domain-containing protein [Candidatus Marinimicrobia bacterium]|nr:T9SS type A sorting domain-containing protein [Candidatus Neomarinimicrobiota bacterium]